MKPLKQPIVTTYHENEPPKGIYELIKERQAEIIREKIADNIKTHE